VRPVSHNRMVLHVLCSDGHGRSGSDFEGADGVLGEQPLEAVLGDPIVEVLAAGLEGLIGANLQVHASVS